MCIRKHFHHAHCRHTVLKTYMCGYGVCRLPSHEIFHNHPGECPDCLGGNNTWPLEKYKVEATQTHDNSSDLKAYAQVMLDLMVCFLISRCAGADQYQGQHIFSNPDLARTVATVILRARFFEKRCRACGESTFDGDLSCGCPAALAPVRTQNPARQCHLRIVQDAHLDTFLQQLPSGEVDLIKRQIAAAHQPSCLMPDLAHSLIFRPYPLAMSETLARVTVVGNAVKDLGNDLQTAASDVLLPAEVQRYTELSNLLLHYFASWMMVNDSGLREAQMKEVLRCLAPCLIHPQGDPRRPPSWSHYFCLDYTAYQYCVGAFLFRFSDSSAELLQQHVHHFKVEVVYPVASRHHVALDSMQQTKQDFYDARVSYYTTRVEEVATGEDADECPICTEEYQDGATGDDEVIMVKKCKHQYHRGCLRRSLMAAARNRWGCPYCRQSIDDLKPDDETTECKKDKWQGYEGKLP